jgi:hypothetical protein
MLGVVAEDDDDAAYASQSSPTRAAKAAKVAPSNGAITAAQVKALSAAAGKAGLDDDDLKALLRESYGIEDGSRKALTKSQASGLIESLTTIVDEPDDSPRWDRLNAAIGRGQ